MSSLPWLLNLDANLPNRLAWRLAALLAGTMALMGVLLHHGYFDALQSQSAVAAAKPLPVTSTSAPPDDAITTDSNRRIEFCAQHVTTERSFVVFAHGTCVIVDEPNEDPVQNAIDLIVQCSGEDARFITRKIEAGGYMITYKEPVFHCLFADEVAQLAPVIDQSYAGWLAPAERLDQPAGWEPPFDAKLGLMTRSFLNADAQTQRVAKVIRAMPMAETAYSAPQARKFP